MASKQTIVKVLAVAGTVWPRDVTPELVGIYAGALGDLSDDALERALRGAVKTCKFFPTPAELRELAGSDEPAIDVDGLLQGIERLSTYNPVTGTRLPAVTVVRDALGDAVADAYALAGGSLLFSRNEFGRADAMRIFRRELVAASLAGPEPTLPTLPSGEAVTPPIHTEAIQKLADGMCLDD